MGNRLVHQCLLSTNGQRLCYRSEAIRKPPVTQINSATPHWDDLYEKMFTGDDLCEFDAVVLVDQPGVRVHHNSTLHWPTYPPIQLHASDLRSLSPASFLATRLQDSPSTAQLPYVRFAPQGNALHDLADLVTQRCGAQRLSFPVGAGPENLESSSGKHVLCLSMPAVTEAAGARRRSVAEHGASILHPKSGG
jgi:hypothetical protein